MNASGAGLAPVRVGERHQFLKDLHDLQIGIRPGNSRPSHPGQIGGDVVKVVQVRELLSHDLLVKCVDVSHF
ncbi:MAG: hypothetical protein IPI75_21020 [Gammaproteobacteria bacterium]|nr:hypothetical protein [Gammaproteobacteria bacterium]